MKLFSKIALAAGVLVLMPLTAAATCTETGFFRDSINMTAAMINPVGTVTGTVNATGCNIGVYFSTGKGRIQQADIYNANYFGVLVNGDAENVAVDIDDSQIHDIGETPFNGAQHGVAVYYRAFFLGGSATGTISGNTIFNYQKGGIVVNGSGASAVVTDNVVTGLGPVNFIAQNGIQFGFGGTGSAMRNTVTGNSYTGSSAASGGILVVGGAGYGDCPDGNPCPYSVGARIIGNTAKDNDVGVFLSNLRVDFSAPETATNVKVVNNILSNCCVTNGFIYQAGVSDVGNNDKIINNKISGTGYDPATIPGSTFAVDADVSFTNRPKVHANK
jgi:parallel beta-helix repeat protein